MKLETSPLSSIHTSSQSMKMEGSVVEVGSPSCSTPSSATSSSGIAVKQSMIIGQSIHSHPQLNPMVQEPSPNSYPIQHDNCPVCGDRTR